MAWACPACGTLRELAVIGLWLGVPTLGKRLVIPVQKRQPWAPPIQGLRAD